MRKLGTTTLHYNVSSLTNTHQLVHRKYDGFSFFGGNAKLGHG